MPQIQAAAAKLAADETTLIAQLRQASWPAPVQPTITNLTDTLSQEQPVYAQCAAATTVAAIKAVLVQNQAKIVARAAASGQVRSALGLPSAAPAPGVAGAPTPSGTSTA